MKTKLFAAFLAVCMVFSLMPVSALAAGEVKVTFKLDDPVKLGSSLDNLIADENDEAKSAYTAGAGKAIKFMLNTSAVAEGKVYNVTYKDNSVEDGEEKRSTLDNDGYYVVPAEDVKEDSQIVITVTVSDRKFDVIGYVKYKGESVPGATVTAVPKAGSEALNEDDLKTTTSETGFIGEYVLHLPKGEYTITATDEEGKRTGSIDVEVIDNHVVENTEINIAEPVTSVEITLDTTAIEAGDKLPTASVTADPENSVEVAVAWKNGTTEVTGTNSTTAGNYTATITVTARTGYELTKTTTFKLNDGKEGTTNPLTATLEVKEKTYTVSGTVSKGDSTLASLENINVTLTPEKGNALTGKTDKDGKYTIVDVPAGNYTIAIAAGDLYEKYEETVEVKTGNVTKNITLVAKKVTLTLSSTPSNGGSISAKVDGKAVGKEIVKGKEVKITISYASPEWTLKTFKVDNKDASASVVEDVYTIDSINANTTVEAEFAKKAYAINIVCDPAKAGTALALDSSNTQITKDVPAGEIVKIKAEGGTATVEEAKVTYVVSGVAYAKTVGEGEAEAKAEKANLDSDGYYRFTMPSYPVTVTVSFAELKVEPGEKEVEYSTKITENDKTALGTPIENTTAAAPDKVELSSYIDADKEASKAVLGAITKNDGTPEDDATVEIYTVVKPENYVAYDATANDGKGNADKAKLEVDVSMWCKVTIGESTTAKVNRELKVNDKVKVTIGVPDDFAKDGKVFVEHRGKVTQETVKDGKIEMEVDGLSLFTITRENNSVAQIGTDPSAKYYASVADAINDALAGDAKSVTIKLLKDDEIKKDITVDREVTITIEPQKDGDTTPAISGTTHIKPGSAVNHTPPASGSLSFVFTAKKSGTVTVNVDGGNGTASVDKTSAYEDETVTITATPASGYTVDEIKVNDGTSDLALNGMTFKMPGKAVTVTVKFKAIESGGEQGGEGGGGGTPAASPVTVAKTENGKAEVSPANAAAGTTVTVNATPDEGYVVDQVKVVDKDGKTVPVTKDKDGKYTFKMPEGGATVTATFKKNPNPVNGFTDVKPGDWFVDAVKYAYDNNLMVGTSDTTFSPAKPVTRAEAAMILYKMNGSPSVAGLSNKFPDVQLGQWYTDAVLWCAANGKIVGYDDGSFGVSDVVTREQIALIFMRQLGGGGRDNLSGFNDAGQVSSWALEGMQWAVANGIINGNGVGLDPRGDTLRCSMAQVLMKANATAG